MAKDDFLLHLPPFGMSSSCQIYSEFADCLRSIVINSHPEWFYLHNQATLLNYLDDFFSGHSNPAVAWKQYTVFQHWLDFLGIPTRPHKCFHPFIEAKVLGFWYDTIFQIFSIPKAKVEKIVAIIDDYLASPRNLSRREISRLVGKLTWASQAVCCSRIMLFSLRKLLLANIGWDVKSLRLSTTARADLRWWKLTLLSYANGIPFKWFLATPSQAQIHVWTDAAGKAAAGCGGFCSLGRFFILSWSDIVLPPPISMIFNALNQQYLGGRDMGSLFCW